MTSCLAFRYHANFRSGLPLGGLQPILQLFATINVHHRQPDLATAHTRLRSLPTSSFTVASTPLTCYSSMSSLPTASSRPMSTPSSPAVIGATQNPSFPTPERFNASSSGSNVATSGGGLKGRRRTGSLGRPQNVPSQHGSKIRPQRTSKVSQKLKILPSPDEQDEESGRDVYSQGASLLHTLKYCRENL